MSEDVKKEWYVVNTYAGQENTVKKYLEQRKKSMGLEDSLFRIVVAEEDGEGSRKKNLFSGYILVEMKMTNEAWYKVRNTPKVTGFIGSSGKGAKPFPIPREEVETILRRLGESKNDEVDFGIGDTVEILTGAFGGSKGTVTAMDLEKESATIQIILFGRETPTDIAFSNLKKIEPET